MNKDAHAKKENDERLAYDAVIVGGGASGLMLAANFDLNGASGLLLEGSRSLGRKLLMSGGGHCNITHGGPVKDFVFAYDDAGKALRRCLYKHNNLELARWFDDNGVPLADEDGLTVDPSLGVKALNEVGRVFPASMKAKDILDTLREEAESNLWQIEKDTKVCGLREAGGLWEITLENEYELRARNVVAATGGITYPETGSDGSMLEILENLGLELTEPRSALAPLYVVDYPYAELAGISLPDVTVVAFSSHGAGLGTDIGKSAKMKGDLLFTHEGLSGPVILNISRYVKPGEKIRLIYNKEMSELPKRMQKVLRDRARGPLGDVRTNLLTALLDQDDFIVERVDEKGMITAGGVALGEIEISTMMSKRFDGLYIIGEALDADGITGGYNLQLCWSTACTCADALKDKLGIQ